MLINLVTNRGLRKLAYGRYLSISRFRQRMGLPASPAAHGPLLDEPDWSYADGTPGEMTKGRTERYLRDQEFGRTMVEYAKQFKAIEEMRKNKTTPQTEKEATTK